MSDNRGTSELFLEESQGLLLLPQLAQGLFTSETHLEVLLREIDTEISSYVSLHNKIQQQEQKELEGTEPEKEPHTAYLTRLKSLKGQLKEWEDADGLPDLASCSHLETVKIVPEKSNLLYVAFGEAFQEALDILDTGRIEFMVLEQSSESDDEGKTRRSKERKEACLVRQYCCVEELHPENALPGDCSYTTYKNLMIIHILEAPPPKKASKETDTAMQQLPYLRIESLLHLIGLQYDETETLSQTPRKGGPSSPDSYTIRPTYEASVDLQAWYCLCEGYQGFYGAAFANSTSANPSLAILDAQVLTAKFAPAPHNQQLFRLLRASGTKHLAKLPVCSHLLACFLLACNLASLSQSYSVRHAKSPGHLL